MMVECQDRATVHIRLTLSKIIEVKLMAQKRERIFPLTIRIAKQHNREMRRFEHLLPALVGGLLLLMMQIGVHDAATNLCSWMAHLVPSCARWLPDDFDKWGLLAPLAFIVGGLGWYFWPEILNIYDSVCGRSVATGNDKLPIREAAISVIEKIEAHRLLDDLLGTRTSAEDKIEHIIFGLLAFDAPIFGKRRPSTKSLEITKVHLSNLRPARGHNELISDFAAGTARYSDVRIKKVDADRYAERLLGLSEQQI